MPEYAFDAKLAVVVRVTADSLKEAREKLEELDSIDICADEGDCHISEGSLDDCGPPCFEIDGRGYDDDFSDEESEDNFTELEDEEDDL